MVRFIFLILALLLAACSSGGDPTAVCENPTLQISNLTLTPDSAVVDEGINEFVRVTVQLDFTDPDDIAAAVNVLVQDSNGEIVRQVWDPGILVAKASYSLTIQIPTEGAEVFTISVFVRDLCFAHSNTLQEIFEVVEVVNAQSKDSVVSGAILGSLNFDVTQIDVSTMTYGLAEGQPGAGAHFEDVDGDGFMDYVFRIYLREADIGCCDSDAMLIGRTFSGAAFAAPIRLRAD